MGLFKPNIEKMRAKNDVKGLIKALKSNNLRVLGAVEDALEDIGHRTIEPFIEALGDKDAGVRSLSLMVGVGNPLRLATSCFLLL